MKTFFYKNNTYESFEFNPENNTISIVIREKSKEILGNGKQKPDKVRKEIYGVVNDKITLIETIKGKHVPTKVIDEHIVWD